MTICFDRILAQKTCLALDLQQVFLFVLLSSVMMIAPKAQRARSARERRGGRKFPLSSHRAARSLRLRRGLNIVKRSRDDKNEDLSQVQPSPSHSHLPGESKKVHAFGGLWNKMYETEIQNRNANPMVLGLFHRNFYGLFDTSILVGGKKAPLPNS